MQGSAAQLAQTDKGTSDTAHDYDSAQVPTLADVPTGRHGSAARLPPTDDLDGGPPPSRRSRRSSPDSSQVGSRSPSRGLIEPVATLPQVPLRVDLSPGRTQPLKPTARERARAINLRAQGVRSLSAGPSLKGEETQPLGSRSKRTLSRESFAEPVSLPRLEPTPAILATGLEPAVEHVSMPHGNVGGPASPGHTPLVSDNGLSDKEEVMPPQVDADESPADAGRDAPSEVIPQTPVIEGQDPIPAEEQLDGDGPDVPIEVPLRTPVIKAPPLKAPPTRRKAEASPKPKAEPRGKAAPRLSLRLDQVESRIDMMSNGVAAVDDRVARLEELYVANLKHFESEMLMQQKSNEARFESLNAFISAVMDRLESQGSTSTSGSSNDNMEVVNTRVHELEIVVKTNHELDSNLDMLGRLDALDKRCHSLLQEVSDRMHGISERYTEMHVKVTQARTSDNESKIAAKDLMLANIADLSDKIAQLGPSDAPQGTQASPAPAPATPPAQAQSSPTVQASQGVGPDPWTSAAADPWSGAVAPPQGASPAPQATPTSTIVTPVAPNVPVDWTAIAQPASLPVAATSVPTSGLPLVAPTFGGPPPMVTWGGLQPPAAVPTVAPAPVVVAPAAPPNVAQFPL